MRLCPLLLLSLLICQLGAGIVINEVCYDPTGTDSGKEWIELYNNGSNTVNLEGTWIQTGGSSYQTVYTFPYYLLRPGRYVLVGESQVTEAVFTATLGFQNGGSETDGIRIVLPGGMGTDTVLYDSPNTSGLFDDTGQAGTSFAPDVPEGYSLARIVNGGDTNASGTDFFAESSPSPGLANPRRVDYAFGGVSIGGNGGIWLSAWIRNRSTVAPDNPAYLRFSYPEHPDESMTIPAIAGGDSLLLETPIYADENQELTISLSIELPADPDTTNNRISVSMSGVQQNRLLINEVMYDPPVGMQEWIEIRQMETTRLVSFSIKDASGHLMGFTLPAFPGYYVLCEDETQFREDYPECPGESIVEVGSMVSLNNDGDELRLLDEAGVVIDSMAYGGSSGHQGKSLERYSDPEGVTRWRYSLDATGSTPGRDNSSLPEIPVFDGKLRLSSDSFFPLQGEMLEIYYNLKQEESRVNCRVYDLKGRKRRSLAESQTVGASGVIVWDGKDDYGKFLPQGAYIILWESQALSGGKIYRRQLEAALGH